MTLNFAFLTGKTCMPQAFYAMNVWCEFNGDWVRETWWKSCDKQTDRQMGRQTKADTELLTVSKNGWWDLAEPGSTFSDRIWNSIKCFRICCEHCKEKLKRMIKTVYSYMLNHCNDSRSSEIPNYLRWLYYHILSSITYISREHWDLVSIIDVQSMVFANDRIHYGL